MHRLAFDTLHNRRESHHIGRTRLAPAAGSQPHRHDFHELFLVEQGRGRHLRNGEVQPLAPGWLVLVLPDDDHHFEAAQDEALCFTNLAVADGWWQAFSATLTPAVGADALARAARNPRHLGPLEQALCQRALDTLLADAPADPARLSAVVAHCLGPLLTAPADAHVTAPPWLAHWREALLRGAEPALPLKDWQTRSGVSPEHLARSCRKHFGESPSTLLSRARIAWVQQHLHPGVSVLDLALEAGFDNLGYFYRCFKRFTGTTPRAWSLQQGNGAVPAAAGRRG